MSWTSPTEALDLLERGAAYRRRVGLRRDEALIFAGVKPGGVSLYFGDEPHFHYDLEGRWQRMFWRGRHHLKMLDGTVEALDRERTTAGLVLRRQRLDYAAASDCDEAARQAALDVLDGLGHGLLGIEPPPAPSHVLPVGELTELLDRVAVWDAAAWFRLREKHVAAYGPGPTPFLPPGCPVPIVLQATRTSRPAGAWVFGPEATAPPAPAAASTPEAFAAHVAAVAALLGRRLALAKGIVLTGPDALRRPAGAILPWLEAATRTFPLAAADLGPRDLADRPEDRPWLDGIYAFLESPAPPRPDRASWRRLREAGLRHVDLGVVSGDPETRRFHALDWSDADLETLVADLKAAGIGLGLIIPAGSGGRARATEHLDATAARLAALPLAAGDVITLVDLGELADDEALVARGLDPLPPADRLVQRADLRARLAPLRDRKVKVVPYTLEKQ